MRTKFCSKKCFYESPLRKSRGIKKGHKLSPERILQISIRMSSQRGENTPNWRGGTSRSYKTGYYSPEYKQWRKSCFERDNYTCQECGITGDKIYLTVHHIKSFAHYPELRFNLENGKTLCESCHSKTDNYRGRNKNKK